MNVLGFESSCDDTGVALVVDGRHIRANVLASQHANHERYGGIVPSLASRQHSRVINLLLEQALEEAGMSFQDVDAVAVSSDQGLAPALAVGVAAAKTVALALDVPLLGVHHVEGHIYSNTMVHPDLAYPFLCLTVAGGHTMLLIAHEPGTYELLGGTRDDSAGEAYDKVARRLGLGYPGGPIIDRLAAAGDPAAFALPRPMLERDGLEFSFSGLKSAVTRIIEQLEAGDGGELPVEDLAASFQAAVVDVLVSKTVRAVQQTGVRAVSVAGGVAANTRLAAELRKREADGQLKVYFPPLDLCVDNAAMIAGVAYHRLLAGERSSLSLDYRANAPLGSLGVRYRHRSKYSR